MAYEVLSNPEKRKLYDQAGEQGIKEGGSGGGGAGMNPMDIFDMFFGGGGGGDPFGRGRQRGPRRTKNLVHQLSVSLEDMYNGTVRKLALQKNVICDGCEGIGGKPGAVQKCPNCRGTGMQVRIQQLGPGMMQQIQSMCGECHGEGEHKASRALRMAAEVIMDSPAALQLRYLQALNSIAAENNSTIIFPIPIDIVAHFMGQGGQNPTQQLQAPAPTHQLSTTSTLRADDSVQIARGASQSP